MENISIKLVFYGAFKKLGNDLTLQIPKESSIKDLKDLLAKTSLKEDTSLLESSALSNNEEILQDSYIIKADETISLLPPVCGG